MHPAGRQPAESQWAELWGQGVATGSAAAFASWTPPIASRCWWWTLTSWAEPGASRVLPDSAESRLRAKEVEKTMEGMALRLKDFWSVTDMIRSDTHRYWRPKWTSLPKAGDHPSFLETLVLQARWERDTFPQDLWRWLGPMGLHPFTNSLVWQRPDNRVVHIALDRGLPACGRWGWRGDAPDPQPKLALANFVGLPSEALDSKAVQST